MKKINNKMQVKHKTKNFKIIKNNKYVVLINNKNGFINANYLFDKITLKKLMKK